MSLRAEKGIARTRDSLAGDRWWENRALHRFAARIRERVRAMSRALFRTMKARCILAILAILLIPSVLPAQSEAEVTALLQRLQSPDAEARLAAMHDLQVSLDPRIPDACLPALQKDGDSVRRLAARAIGSRWHQIPKERVPVFIAALKAHLKSEHEGLVNMARRGIALLDHSYAGKMLSRSKSKRWVIYERHGLPCLIDTANGTEELLGFGAGGDLAAAWGNTEVAPAAVWHPKADMVALEILQGRKLSTVWTWAHGKGLRRFTEAEILKSLGYPESAISGASGFYTSDPEWSGDNLRFRVSFTVKKGEDFIEHEARLLWNPAKDKLQVASDKIVR